MSSLHTAEIPSLEEMKAAAGTKHWSSDGGMASDLIENFLVQSHSALDTSGIQGVSTDKLVSILNEFWNWGEERPGHDPLIRTRTISKAPESDSSFTVLEIIGPDMPFLVGSIVGACRDLKAHVGQVLHPIIEHGRTELGARSTDDGTARESYIIVFLELLDHDSAKNLEKEVSATLKEVRLTVVDFDAMQSRMRDAADIVSESTFLDHEIAEEAAKFLNWMAGGHFTFLGSRFYTFAQNEDGSLAVEEPLITPDSSLGILRDENRFILHRGSEPTIITNRISDFLNEPTPLIVAKATLSSRVHRRVNADYVGVKQYDNAGQVVGEIRFVGLFTADAYNSMARDIPLIRQKVERALQAAGKRAGSHDANALKHILETYPRDELFQIGDDDLLRIATDILHLQDRSETRLFIRKDRFDRHVSALVYVPKESFNSDLRARIGATIAKAYGGKIAAFYPLFGDAPLARIHFIIALRKDHLEPDIGALEAEIAVLARNWTNEMRAQVRANRSTLPRHIEEEILAGAFNAAYREEFSPETAIDDIRVLTTLSDGRKVALRAFRGEHDPLSVVRAKIYTLESPVQLSECVPVFENMGLFVRSETGFPIKLNPEANAPSWIHSLTMNSANNMPIELGNIKSAFEDAFEAVWTGKTESDGFNKLVMAIGANWREAALLRTLARYRRQTGQDPAQTTQIRALAANPEITALLLQCFRTRFDPDLDMSLDERNAACKKISGSIIEALNKVESLDEDRVLRRFSDLIYAIKRTTFFQLNDFGEPHIQIAIKIASRELESLPEPRPFREIFVWAPHVEGVHLRFGPVARGGLRWSDRRDDFRTEVLGLVKAQQVKNAVIVPVGSKGGFYPKHLPTDGDRDAVRDEGIRAYKTFISSLLMLTDNILDGVTRHPTRTVIWDEPDPYLVVAADKGTATFSDIANDVSESYGFWLGDAFASGGSVGYDHKKMGITARGGWVAVQRHFREMGINVQTDPFSVIGVGDMSGDVFGNGMLLSKTILLKAAFNHLHIFIDPSPTNPEACWAERQRLFDLPRSSWSDYSPELISKGGGVFSRSAKTIEISPEIRAFLGIRDEILSPDELLNAVLKAKADLLWFGGIGTYVKGSGQSHLDVGDKTNDTIRINANELAVKVIGEGANLGMTQASRIEFARKGGRINTDAVDNSAGVDSSDHEVNIKILVKNAIESGEVKPDDRTQLLSSMTEEVAELVLVHNYDQTGALSVAEASAAADLDSHERMMERLEAAGILNRSVEGLPKPEEVRALHDMKVGLTRPEIAVLLAYAKITLFDELVASSVPDDPYMETSLLNYFPSQVRGYTKAINEHRLKREIISTRLANDIINLGGSTFVHRVKERAGVETAAIARAFVASKTIFSLSALLGRLDGLDNQVPAGVQITLRLDLINALRRQVFWLAKTRPDDGSIGELVETYKKSVSRLIEAGEAILSPYERTILQQKQKAYVKAGAPVDLARDVAIVQSLTSATDIVDLSNRSSKDVLEMAHLFSAVGNVLQFDRLRQTALTLKLDQHWDRLAIRGLVETLLDQQNVITTRISEALSDGILTDFASAKVIVEKFISDHSDSHQRLNLLLAELEQSGAWTFAKLVLFNNAMRGFIEETEAGAN